MVDEVQRELLCNLLREHSPTLIALTGRQLYGADGVPSGGSARLSRATDQVTTRYVASFSPQHLDRVRTALRQEERLARLEAMDVNPLGEAEFDAAGDVTLRLVDGQVSVSSAMAHALLVQALAMRARELARTGRRIGAVPQPLVERNRARAVAHGLAAGFETEQHGGDRRTEQRGGGDRRTDRRGGRTGGPAADRPPRTVPAARAASALMRELLPYFRQLDATADELGQLFTGLELSGGGGSGRGGFVRNENDLLARWRGYDPRLLGAEQLADGLGRPGWLLHDHIGAANTAMAAGSSAAARIWLTEQLTAPAPSAASRSQASPAKAPHAQASPAKAPHPAGSSTARPPRRRGPSDEQFLNELAHPGTTPEQALAALRAHCRPGGTSPDLARALQGRDREQAKALRRLLRPAPALRVRLNAPPGGWDEQKLAQAVRGAAEQGTALLHWDVPAADRPVVRARLRELGPAPHGLRTVLLTDLTYTAKADERRGTLEVLLVAPAEEPAR
ncbi:hypothetical protein ABZW03_25535 [Kitasatospora sp. NPDC004799]|uniref:hypothetical protein n=1 Tax=Kitasatospora sp. NPDC004799 TaxID=3154460 RepID=UPI0033A6AD55